MSNKSNQSLVRSCRRHYILIALRDSIYTWRWYQLRTQTPQNTGRNVDANSIKIRSYWIWLALSINYPPLWTACIIKKTKCPLTPFKAVFSIDLIGLFRFIQTLICLFILKNTAIKVCLLFCARQFFSS